MSDWLTHFFFLFCVKLFLPIMSLWPYLLKCYRARQEKKNKSITSLWLNKLRLKQGSLTFDNDLVMPHAFFELVSYGQSCYAHTRLCCGRFAPWLIWKQADAAHSPAGSKKTPRDRNGWERLEIWGAIALRGRTFCPLSHGVSLCCAVRLKLLPRNQINLLWTSTVAVTEKWRAQRLWHMFTTDCSFITAPVYDTAGCSLKII